MFHACNLSSAAPWSVSHWHYSKYPNSGRRLTYPSVVWGTAQSCSYKHRFIWTVHAWVEKLTHSIQISRIDSSWWVSILSNILLYSYCLWECLSLISCLVSTTNVWMKPCLFCAFIGAWEAGPWPMLAISQHPPPTVTNSPLPGSVLN